jgi:hypothetical protein
MVDTWPVTVTSGKENEMSLRGPRVEGRLADKQLEPRRLELLGGIRPGCCQGLSQMALNAIQAAPSASVRFTTPVPRTG